MTDQVIYVSLDTSKDPKVQVNPVVLGKPKIKWRVDTDSPESFKFKSLVFDYPAPFTEKKFEDHKINVDDDMSTAEPEYPYTLTVVDDNGDEYNTTTDEMVPGDKPVIRN